MKNHGIQSMTGYGIATKKRDSCEVSVEIFSLNSKVLDLSLEGPSFCRSLYLGWRKILQEKLKRGKIYISITLQEEKTSFFSRNEEDIIKNFHDLKKIAKKVESKTDCLSETLKLYISENNAPKIEKSCKKKILEILFTNALKECLKSRKEEGERLQAHILGCKQLLEKQIKKIITFLPIRKRYLNEKLQEKKYSEEASVKKIDPLAWENETKQYWEKINIEEEIVRLKSHLDYLEKSLTSQSHLGKKINFILQEMSRELNTIGAKAQEARLQHMVIETKESLEMIKEQTQNIL